MIRAVFYFLQLAALVALAVWLADRPGSVSIDWLGYRIETYVGVLLAAGVLFFAALLLIYRLWRGFTGAPGAFFDRRSRQRQEKGYRALTLGMAAVAVGDAEEARRQAKQANQHLREPDLTGLLSAQAASLNGDHDAARRYFEDLRSSPDTEFLGVTGLLRQATASGDEDQTFAFAQKAWELRPDQADVVNTLFALQTKRGLWFDAQRTLYDAVRRGIMDEASARSYRTAILVERARLEVADGKTGEAMKHLDQALEATANFAPAVVLKVDMLVKQGKQKRALMIIEDAWRRQPHPDLAAAYKSLLTSEDALGLVKRIQDLVKSRPDVIESRIALAETALDAQLWGEARAQLDAIADSEKSVEACRLMARLEDAEHQDLAKTRVWLERAGDCGPDPAWVCSDCGAVQREWNGLCGNCGHFDTVDWQVPPRVTYLTGKAAEMDEPMVEPEKPLLADSHSAGTAQAS